VSFVERELKLGPADPRLLDRLASLDRFGQFEVTGRRHELQHNSFFDTRSRALTAARIGFRRRTIDGQRLATWTVKADGEQAAVRGVATRTEIELQLDPDMPPALALTALRSAARPRNAVVLAEALDDALADGGLPLAKPFLELETDRLIVDLAASSRAWNVELALDRVHLIGHDEYRELEIEAELKKGDVAALEAVRTTIEALGEVHESEGSKLSRAMAHLKHCVRGTADHSVPA
jgi:inorganic triphosphatase YgiF